MSNVIKVSVLGEVRDINNKLGQVNSKLSGFGKTAGRIGGLVAGAFAGVAVGQAVKSIVSAASDAQQSLGATETVFGRFSDTVVKTSNRAATQFGLDANTYRENANILGALFSNQGVAANKLAGATKQMIGVGSDLAATFGGTTTEAVDALSAAFKGEFDSLEKYGISLKESTVSAELAARGQDKLTGAALAAAKQQVVSDLIMKQSSKTRGAFARENNTLAHQQQVLAAQVENLKAKIGSALLPILTKAAMFVNSTVLPALKRWYATFKSEIVPVIQEVASRVGAVLLPVLQQIGTFITGTVVPGIKSLVAAFIEYQNIILPVVAGIAAMVVAYQTYQKVMLVVQAVQKAWIAVQAALNVVMAANPIGLVVLAIVGLAAAFVVAYKKSETFRNIVNGAWNAIKAATSAVWGFLKGITVSTWNAIKNAVTNPVQTLKGLVTGAWNGIKSVTNSVWNGIKSLTSSVWNGIKAVITSVVNGAKSAVTGAWNAVKSATSTIWNALKGIVTNAINNVMNVVNGIKGKVLGAFAGAATWLYTVGQNVIQGLINGIGSMIGSLISKAKSMVSDAIGAVKGAFGVASPSRVMKQIGVYVAQGLEKGITEGAPAVTAAMESIATKVEDVWANRGSKAIDKVTAKMKKQGYSSEQIAKHTKKLGNYYEDMGKWAVGTLKDEAKALKDNANARAANNTKLVEARTRLQELRQAAADYAATIANNIVGFGNVTGFVDDLNNVSSEGIIRGLSAKVQQAQEYARLIQQLTAAGLNQTTIEQLVQAGVEGGLATANALVIGGQQAISQVNSLTGQLQAVGTNLGNSTAHTMYGAGIQAAEGLVQGYESMADRLERAGDRLARKMVKAIKKALDINSPSRVFRKIGEQTTAGLEIALKDTKGVERATTNIGRAMEHSFGSPRLEAEAIAARKSNTQPPVQITVQVGNGVVNGAAVGREIKNFLQDYYNTGGKPPVA